MSIRRCLRGVALAVLAASATGCDKKKDAPAAPGEWPDDGRWWSDADGADSGGGSGGMGEEPPYDGEDEDEESSRKLAVEVTRIFGAHCAPCHAGRNGIVFGDFGDIYDVSAMTVRGFITPLFETSPLYQLVASDLMPPTPFGTLLDPSDPTKTIAKVSTLDKALLAQWISAGAPNLRDGDVTETVALQGAQFRAILLDDLERKPPAERTNYRYISLYDASRNSFPPEYIASPVNLALNRLSTSRGTVARPTTVLGPGDALIALRIDLREYGLDAADWARLEAATELVDRQAFPCDVPFLDATTFLQLALNDELVRTDGTLESIYSNIALRRVLQNAGVLAPGQLVFEPAPPPAGGGVPLPLTSTVTLPQLASALGVDLAGNMALGGAKAMRACFRSLGETGNARCVQRDTMPGGIGRGFWWTMDVGPELAVNPLETPIGPGNGGLAPAPAQGEGFDLSEGQAFWPWPNANVGFAVFDDQLRLRSSRPSTASIEASGDSEAMLRGANGRSCTSFCHSLRMLPVVDELGGLVENGTAYGPDELAFVERLLRTKGETDAQMALDEVLYTEGRRASCVKQCYSLSPFESNMGSLPFYTIPRSVILNTFFLDGSTLGPLIESDPELPTAFLSLEGVSRKVFVEGFDAVRRAAIKAGGDEATLQLCVQPASND